MPSRALAPAALFVLACGSAPPGHVRTPGLPGLSLVCLDRGSPVARRPVDAPGARLAEAFVSPRVVVYRDDNGSLVARALGDGATLGRASTAGRLLFADERGAALWQFDGGARRVTRVSFAGGAERRSDPLPLPNWILASSEDEPAESLDAWPEGDDVVLAWTAMTSWRGGYPPSPEEEAEARHQDCGSLRVDARGRVTAGNMIPSARADQRPSPSPLPQRSYQQQLYAGEGAYWINDIDPRGDAATRHSLVERSGRAVAVQLPPPPADAREQIAGALAVGERVVVWRVFRALEGYRHAQSLAVIDRRTGALAWSAAAAPLQEPPRRP